jgi:lipopolysaccharide biosynthesis glycosyltransferase
MSNHPIAASPDASESGKRLGFNDDDVYFNSGVLLINLKYWREHDCQSQLFEFIDNHKNEFPLPDQDPLNIIFKDSKLHLDLRYNLQPIALYKDYYVSFPWHKYEDEFRRAQVNPAIIHYAGVRPWEKRCKHPYKEEWFKYRAMTKWTNMPLAPSRITATTRLKNFIRMLLTPFGVCHYVRDYYNRNMHLES